MQNKTTIPRFEPEVIAAEVRKRRGDDEKVPTTSISSIVVDGVTLSSRYSKAHELELMASVIAALPADLRQLVEQIFCDSQAYCYEVTLRSWDKRNAAVIGHLMEQTVDGHNGITLTGPGGEDLYLPLDLPSGYQS